MFESPNLQNRFRSSQSALLLLLIISLCSSCTPNRGPLDTQSTGRDVGETKENRDAVAKINPDRSPPFRQQSEGSKRPKISGSKDNVAMASPDKLFTEGAQSELKGSLKKAILEGYILKVGIEREYRLNKREDSFEGNVQALTRTWSFKAVSWAEHTEDLLKKIDSAAKEQFRVYHGPLVSRGVGDEKWGNIDNWLNDKLDFLGRFYERLGTK